MCKRILAIAMTLTLLLSVTACAGKTPEPVPTTGATIDIVTTTEPSYTDVTTTESVVTTKPTMGTTNGTTVTTTTHTTTARTTSRIYQFLPTTYDSYSKIIPNTLGDGCAACYMFQTRQGFYRFIQAPKQAYLDSRTYIYTSRNIDRMEGNYVYIDLIAVDISLAQLADSAEEIKEYLQEHGIDVSFDETIVETAIVTTPGIPVVLWARSDRASYYIVQDQDPRNEEFVCYTADAFQENYLPRPATLFVNGKQVASGEPVLLHHDHADVPFMGILEALGAEVSWADVTTATVVLNGESYVFDTQKVTCLSSSGRPDPLHTALFTKYRLAQTAQYELFLDTKSAELSLSFMDADVDITLDRDANRVVIKRK